MLWLSFPCSNSEYEMWRNQDQHYFQIQELTLYGSHKMGNSWVPIPVTQSESGPSTALKMTVPSTSEEKTCKKNDVKARSLLLMALPNEHQLTFDQYVDAQSMFAAIKSSPICEGIKQLKEDKRALNETQYENFNRDASSTNNINTATPEVSTGLAIRLRLTLVSTSSMKTLEQLQDMILEEMDPKVEYALLRHIGQGSSIRERGRMQRHQRSKDRQKSEDKVASCKAVKIADASEKQCVLDRCIEDLLVKLNDIGFKAATYKRGHKEYQIRLLREELEKVKLEKEGFEFKIAKFEKSAKDLDQLLASQITDKSKKGFGYNVVPSPHPLILNRPTPLDLSYSCLKEFKQPEVNEYGPRDSSLKPTTGCDKESDNSKENTDDSLKQQQKTATETSFVKSSLKVDKDWKENFFYPANHVREEEPKKARENTDAPIIEDWVSDDEDEVEPIPKVEKKTAILTATKKESVKPEKPARRSVSCPKNMVPKAVLMKTGLKTVNNARLVNTVRFVNTGRPFSTARPVRSTVNTVRARGFNAVKPSACWVWRPIKPNGASLSNSQLNDKGFLDSGCSRSLVCFVEFVKTNGHQFTISNRLQELTSPEQTATALASPKQTAIGKDSSNPLMAGSLPKTILCVNIFWMSAEATNDDNGEVKLTATIDGHSMTITEASLRRHLKLDDHDGITSLPNSEIFAHLALMGYYTDSDKLTFQKGAFSPQWRFLIHTILYCISPKKTAWEQFSSNIATAVICLATNRRYNFSSFKVFNNMKRPTKGYSGEEVALFPTMLQVTEPSPSPEPLHSPEPSPSPEPSFEHSPEHTTAAVTQPSLTQPSPTQPSPGAEHHFPTPHDSHLHAVHSHGSDKGSLKLNELTTLVTKLSDRVAVLEDDLKKTKLTYSTAVTNLILRVKKLEHQVKSGKARKRAKFVLSEDDEDIADDSSKQGRKLSDAE
ncbi:hypothetical protein Tco_1505883, partial [Tanacetum coccineum]